MHGSHGELNIRAQMPLLIKRTSNCECFRFDDVTNNRMYTENYIIIAFHDIM